MNKNNKTLYGIEVGQIILVNCSNFNIINVNISNTDVGIESAFSDNINISCCNLSDNDELGIFLSSSNNNTISSCNIFYNGDQISYYYDQGILLYQSNNNTISNCNISNNSGQGILLIGSNNNTISNCNIFYNYEYAVEFYGGSNNNTISNCNISDNDIEGIRICNSTNNIISSCNISNNHILGIYIYYSNNNTILSCIISNNGDYGIQIRYSSYNNTITCCDIFNNHDYGINIDYGINSKDLSNGNIIFRNNIINNRINAIDDCSNNWDNGKEGNYWDDYDGEDTNGDGVGETPYKIPGGDNEDRYPLVKFIDMIPPKADAGPDKEVPVRLSDKSILSNKIRNI